MKKVITLFLIIFIQITFMQKVIASVQLLNSDQQSMMVHCDMKTMHSNSVSCMEQDMSMDSCQSDCEMMSVVSVIHFIENNSTLYFDCTQLRYPFYNVTTVNALPTSLYRPPLFS
jgi:hypothetical protein